MIFIWAGHKNDYEFEFGWIISEIRNDRKIPLASTPSFLLLDPHHREWTYLDLPELIKPLTNWRWTVPLNNAQMRLGALGELQLRRREVIT